MDYPFFMNSAFRSLWLGWGVLVSWWITAVQPARADLFRESGLSVSQISELNFGEAPQGDWAKDLYPGISPTASLGAFLISGPRGQSFTIVLPSSSIELQNSQAGAAPSRIEVSGFRSVPPSGACGQLDSLGRQTVYVGARRAALAPNQGRGRYFGSYQFSVIF